MRSLSLAALGVAACLAQPASAQPPRPPAPDVKTLEADLEKLKGVMKDIEAQLSRAKGRDADRRSGPPKDRADGDRGSRGDRGDRGDRGFGPPRGDRSPDRAGERRPYPGRGPGGDRAERSRGPGMHRGPGGPGHERGRGHEAHRGESSIERRIDRLIGELEALKREVRGHGDGRGR